MSWRPHRSSRRVAPGDAPTKGRGGVRESHALLSVAATALAVWQWQPSGARTLEECRAYIIQASRRRVGLVAVQAMARHRLARAPYIGVTRAVVEARHRRGSVGPSPPLSDAWGRFEGIYQWQADHRTAVVA